MKGKQLAKLIGTLCVMGVVILGVYLALHTQEDDGTFAKDGTANTEAQAILAKDVARNYPANQREVVRLFARISKCFYNEKISEEEFHDLIEMQRMLFDEELLEENPLEDFTARLSLEIENAKKTETTMVNYRVQKQSSVADWPYGEDSLASIIASFTMKGEKYTKSYEEFLLREDEKGNWKIVGWRLTDPVEIED